jgi:hypothetical protein
MPSRILPHAILTLAVVLLLGQLSSVSAAEEAVAAAWARSKKIQTADITLKVTEITLRNRGSEPPAEARLESRNRLVIDGVMIRYENNHPVWNANRSAGINIRRVAVSTPAASKLFFPQGMGGKGPPSGVISEGERPLEIGSSLLLPLRMTFRGLEPRISSYLISDLKSADATAVIDGTTCQEYVVSRGDRTTHFWLDPSREHVVRRIRSQRGTHTTDQLDAEYRLDRSGGWVPHAWVLQFFKSPGFVPTTWRVEMAEMRINDPEFAEMVDLDFPPGTRVQDQRTERHLDYLVDSVGSWCELPPIQVERPSDSTPSLPWYQRDRPVAFGILAILALLILLVLLRRRRLKLAAV